MNNKVVDTKNRGLVTLLTSSLYSSACLKYVPDLWHSHNVTAISYDLFNQKIYDT